MSVSGSSRSVGRGSSRERARRARSAAARAAREVAAEARARQRQRAQRRPQRGGGRAGARALEADLAEVQVVRGEVRVRRVVGVEPADAGIGEQDAAAAVGLEAVLVRVDHDRVGARDRRERRAAPRRARRRRRAARRSRRRRRRRAGGRRAPRTGRRSRRRRRSRRARSCPAWPRPCRRRRARSRAASASRSMPPARVLRRRSRGGRRARRTRARACSGRSRPRRSRASGCSSRATQSASRLAIVPDAVRCPRCCGEAEHRRRAARPPRAPSRRWPARRRARGCSGSAASPSRTPPRRPRVRRLEHLAGVARVGVGVRVAQPLGQLAERRPLGRGRGRGASSVSDAEREQGLRPGRRADARHRRRETDVARVHASQPRERPRAGELARDLLLVDRLLGEVLVVVGVLAGRSTGR